MFNEGISATGDILDLGVVDEIVEKSGAWFSYKGTRLGQGRENTKVFLRDNPELMEEIRSAILAKRSHVQPPPKTAKPATPADDDDE